ncbi:MAG: DinB family protein [Chitinophagaceae bacterium]
MKKLLLLAAIAMLASFVAPLDSLSKKERKFAISFLKDTKKDLEKSIAGLSDAQLNFKPAPDRWSIKECVYHIAMAEPGIRQFVDVTMKAPANPEKRTDIKMTDEQIIKGVEDRSHKAKAPEQIQPQNAKWTNVNDALKSFEEDRAKLINYIKDTPDEMRNHVSLQSPLGPVDAYQLVLLIGAHTNRHMQQINEVKADPNFPKQ